MKIFFALLSLFVLPGAFASPTVLSAKDMGWEIRFDAPPTEKIDEVSTATAYRYVGNAGKFNLSLFIEPPQCGGGSSRDAQVHCFFSRIERVPGLVKETIRVSQLSKAVQVSYIAYTQVGDAAVKVLHSHVLFSDMEKWGDLHGSVLRPTTAEIAMLLALGDGFIFTN